jgi:MFS family permease
MKKFFGMNKNIFSLGLVSFFTDISSEMLIPVVPQFLRFVLGASMPFIGMIEGVAEATASLLRVFSGYIADKTGKPKVLTVIGYGMSALSKPFYLLVTIWPTVLAIRFADRLGKGIRSAPRDVLLADASDETNRGRAFGFHRAMDTAGASLGPLVVIALVWLLAIRIGPQGLGHNKAIYHAIFLAAAIPALLGWLVLVFFVSEKKHEHGAAKMPDLCFSCLDRRFKIFLAIVTFFSVGNSSDAFLVLRATEQTTKGGIGMGFIQFLWVYAVFNILSAFVAARSGILSDKIGRKPIIIAGWLVFSVVYFAMARITTSSQVWTWFVIYGIYYGLTDGMLRAFAIDLAPAHMRGTAVGAYFTFTGLALLPASVIAGLLWKYVAPGTPFYLGSAIALLSAILMATLVKWKPQGQVQGQ